MNKKNLILCMLATFSLSAATVLQAEETSPPADAPQQQNAAPAYLGVVIGSVPQVVQAQLPEDITQNQGLMVMRVMPDSPAAKAGLKRHDVLLTFDGKKLISPKDLVSSVNNKAAGEQSRLEILRHGKVTGIEVTMAIAEGRQPGSGHSAPRHHPMQPQLHHRPDSRGDAAFQKNFQAMAVNRLPNGNYKAMIEFLDQDGNLKKFEYEGTHDALRAQIKKEKDLPGAHKQQLLSALHGRTPGFPMQGFPAFPGVEGVDREFFSPLPPWARPYRPGFWD